MSFVFGILVFLGGLGCLALGVLGLIAGVVTTDQTASTAGLTIFISGIVITFSGHTLIDA